MSAVVNSLMPEFLVARNVARARPGEIDQRPPQGFSTAKDAAARLLAHRTPLDRTERIRRRAYELYEARGRADGYDVADWLEAERQIDSGR